MRMEITLAKSLDRLKKIDAELQKLAHISALLSWDQETFMPDEAVGERAEQLALLEGIMHDRFTSSEAGELLGSLGVGKDTPTGSDDFNDNERAFLREFYRRYRRKTQLPRRLVTEMARQTAIARKEWAKARAESNFSIFAPHLDKILALTLEVAECLGYEDSPYDPLLDEYEPWMKTSKLEEIFRNFQEKLMELISRIVNSEKRIDTHFLMQEYDTNVQRDFSLHVLKTIGYDFSKGRLDVSAHPFTTTLGCSDVRLTTRYNRNYFNTGIFGTIHEGGHALYELGISAELQDTLLADGTSMGIHESQSRMWENIIGRSLPFWKHFFPGLKSRFPEALGDVDLVSFYRAINAVQPSLIRVEADEVTYNLHILLRFNLEKRLISGDLKVKDMPEAWNEECRSLLGIVPPNDADGVLQDIHWSMGSIGYFPTYSLGNLYSAQFFKALEQDLPDIDGSIEIGDFQEILKWLRQKIHSPGRVYPAGELCERVTGESLNPDYFMDYLENKYSDIYGI